MKTVFEQVCEWNAARYDRVYNHDLAVALIEEEYQEWFDNDDPVEKLDALCDLAYVAFGMLWKLNVDVENDNVLEIIIPPHPKMAPIYHLSGIIAMWKGGKLTGHEAAHNILASVCNQACHVGYTYEEFVEAMQAVCDSNASKAIKKTASDVKANGNDKGSTYVPPTEALNVIYLKMIDREAKETFQ